MRTKQYALACLVVLLTLTQGCDDILPDKGRALVNAASGSTNEVILALAAGANVNERSRKTFGWPPLTSAIYHHNEDVVDLLLANGASPNVPDKKNQTPLLWAIESWPENTNLLLKLVRHGGDPRFRNRYGMDAFDLAKQEQNSEKLLETLSLATNFTSSGGSSVPPSNPQR
jgi:ankyrin repeat protein